MWYLDHLFARFRWFRRMRGGHWEQWWIDMPVCSTLWLRREHGTRPGLGVYPDACEDHEAPKPIGHPYRSSSK